MKTGIREIFEKHDNFFNKSDFLKWLSDNRKKLLQKERTETKLQKDKEELLEALEKLRNHYGLFPENRIEIESLIQKHKK